MRTPKLLYLAVFFVACSDPEKRPLGSTCEGDEQCASGLCLANECVDPAGDEDGDGLTNGLEAALGTDAFVVDTDLDGKDDLAERGTGTSPRDTDGDGIPDALESAIADADGDCIPDELDPDDDGLDPTGCAPGDTSSPDTTDVHDATDTNGADTEPDEVGPSDTEDTDASDTPVAPDTEDTEDTAGEVFEPTARCDEPVLVMSETLGHFFTSPVASGGAGAQAAVTFQSGQRNHYALRFGHFGWVGPELMASGVETNVSMEPRPLSVSNRLVAFRAAELDGLGGLLAIWSWRTEAWSTTTSWPGFGTYAGAHAVQDDETILAVSFVGGQRGLELFRWHRSTGFGPATMLAPYGDEMVFETTLVVDGLGDGAVLAYLSQSQLLDAYPLRGGAPVGPPSRLGPTGTQKIDSDFSATRLPSGELLLVWTEGTVRVVSAVFSVVAEQGVWSEPRVIAPTFAARPHVRVDAMGRALAIYSNEEGDHWLRREANGTWSEARPMGTRNAHDWHLVEDQVGSMWATWTTEAGVVEVLRLSPSADAWTVVDRFERADDELSRGPAVIALTPEGDPLVVWGSNIGTGARVSAVTCH